MDLVGTCPKWFWNDWLQEGDLAGEPESGREYGWRTRRPLAARLILHRPEKVFGWEMRGCEKRRKNVTSPSEWSKCESRVWL